MRWLAAGIRIHEQSGSELCAEAIAKYLTKRDELKAEHFGQYVALQNDGTYILTGKDGPIGQYLGFNGGPGGMWLKIGLELGQEEPQWL